LIYVVYVLIAVIGAALHPSGGFDGVAAIAKATELRRGS
jgi:hypothetical protein